MTFNEMGLPIFIKRGLGDAQLVAGLLTARIMEPKNRRHEDIYESIASQHIR